jgi:hypothetical protein
MLSRGAWGYLQSRCDGQGHGRAQTVSCGWSEDRGSRRRFGNRGNVTCADTETRRVWKHEFCLVGIQDSYHRSFPFLCESTRCVLCPTWRIKPNRTKKTRVSKWLNGHLGNPALRLLDEACCTVRYWGCACGCSFRGRATWRSLGCAWHSASVVRVRLPLIRPLCCETWCTCAILLFFRVSVSRVASSFQGYSWFLLHSWFGVEASFCPSVAVVTGSRFLGFWWGVGNGRVG